MIKSIYLALFVLGFITSGFASTSDSLLVELNKSNPDTAKLSILNTLIKTNLWNDTEQAFRFAEIYDSIAQRTQNLVHQGKGKNFKGMCYYAKGDTDLAIDKYYEAIRYFEKAKDTLFIGILYNNIGASYSYREKHEETIKFYEKALEYFKAINNEEWIVRVYANLAIQTNMIGDYEKSVRYNEETLEFYRKKGDRHMMGVLMNNMGATYFFMEEYYKCIKICESALEHINPQLDSTLLINAQNNIAVSYLKLNYPEIAKPYIDQTLVLSRRLQKPEWERNALSSLSLYYEQTGNYEKALKYYKDYESVKDAFFNEVKDATMAEAATRYDSEKKEQEIKLLAAVNENQELKLAQSRRQSIFFVLGIVGLAILLLVLFYAFRLKQKSLSEKELLLKEIHHRVKNNLQVVTSLLNIQQRRITDKQAIAAIQESKTRVESMALIHQSLYQNNDLSNVNAKEYVQNLINFIFNTYKVDQDKINYQLEVQQLKMDLDTLIPLGLIINELVSNALKHAFKDREVGMINISMRKDNNRVTLKVSDNGVGLPDTDVLTNSNSFGYKMIKAFVKKLNATMDIIRKEGTTMNIAFES